MTSKFNRQSMSFRNGRDVKNNKKNSKKSTPSSKDIEVATQAFLKKGGEIERVIPNNESSKNEVFRANLEPDSRLGMGTIVDESWDCWENKDYDTNPGGSTI